MDIHYLKNIKEKHILVIGDIMLDRYINGTVNRQSPEAPVPVLLKDTEYSKLGGAANVALNVQALESRATLIGTIGNDEDGQVIRDKLNDFNVDHHLIVVDKITTVKERYLHGKTHLLRVDKEDTADITAQHEKKVIAYVADVLSTVDGVIISDYDKGMLTSRVITSILPLIKKSGKPVFVDPKFKNYSAYQGVQIFKPNKKEMLASYKGATLEDSILKSAISVRSQHFICTLGEKGIACVTADDISYYSTDNIEEVDVCGAGDTVIAMLAIGYMSGLSQDEFCNISNTAGKLACMTSGVANITLKQIEKDISRRHQDII